MRDGHYKFSGLITIWIRKKNLDYKRDKADSNRNPLTAFWQGVDHFKIDFRAKSAVFARFRTSKIQKSVHNKKSTKVKSRNSPAYLMEVEWNAPGKALGVHFQAFERTTNGLTKLRQRLNVLETDDRRPVI